VRERRLAWRRGRAPSDRRGRLRADRRVLIGVVLRPPEGGAEEKRKQEDRGETRHIKG